MIELGELLRLAPDAAGELGVGAAELLERALFLQQRGAQGFAQAQYFGLQRSRVRRERYSQTGRAVLS